MEIRNDQPLDGTVQGILVRKLAEAGYSGSELAQNTNLLELGLIDSEALVEVILEVEERCDCEFDPAEIDLESGLTLARFVSSFVMRG